MARYLDQLKHNPDELYESPAATADDELIQLTFDVIMQSMLFGMTGIMEEDFSDPLPDPLPFEEAVEFARDRIPLTKKEFNRLNDELRFRAFTVSRLTTLDAVKSVQRHFVKVVETGETLKKFIDKTNAAELMGVAGWGGESPAYWENVYRTNIQTCFNSGRLISFEKNQPEYLEFIGIEDSRQTDICQARNNIILPFNDPFWANNIPPLHYQCRSTVRGIYREEAEARGLSATEIPAGMPPLKGFGSNPLIQGTYWKPTESMKKRLKGYGLVDEVNETAKQLKLDFELDQPKGLAQEYPVNTYMDIDILLHEYADRNPAFFRAGFKKFSVEQMQYSFASTNTAGTITFSNRHFPVSGNFQPSVDLKNAMKKIEKQKALTFNEEYAVETLWHEILHNRRKGVVPLKEGDVRRMQMEAINQLYARHTYGEFLETLGGKARYSTKILESGYGYSENIQNVRYLLKELQISEKEAAEKLHGLLDQNWQDLHVRSADLIGSLSKKDSEKINFLLINLSKDVSLFKMAVKKVLG